MPIRNNVTRLLDQRKIWYQPVEYDPSSFHSATEVAALVGAPSGQVFKTIVIVREAKGQRPLLVIVPGDGEVDLKRLASELGEKKLRAAPQREAEALTRLQVGGISALALINRGFDVVLDRTAERYAADGIYVSGGQRGLNVKIKPADLLAITGGRLLDAMK
ncbi:MAG: YbaK/EbsC family protein [Dehalococcoidia bacterium]